MRPYLIPQMKNPKLQNMTKMNIVPCRGWPGWPENPIKHHQFVWTYICLGKKFGGRNFYRWLFLDLWARFRRFLPILGMFWAEILFNLDSNVFFKIIKANFGPIICNRNKNIFFCSEKNFGIRNFCRCLQAGPQRPRISRFFVIFGQTWRYRGRIFGEP